MKEKFYVSGMTCSACSAGIERTLLKLNGVEKAEVSLMGESMVVDYDNSVLAQEEIINAVVGLGYGVTLFKQDSLKNNANAADLLKKRFFISLLFLIPLMYFSMGGMISLPQPTPIISYSIQMVLTMLIIVVNFKFFTSGVKALVKLVPNMDTLVAMGSAVSFIYSFVLTILTYIHGATHGHLFYESAAMILTLVTLGKWLEEKSKRKTGDEIEKLIKLMPNTVTVERNGSQCEIAFSGILVGDILVVKQGEYVPVDGKIIEGHAFIDRAAITGESLPIEVVEGDTVTGADIVKSGYLKVLAQKIGADTTLSQIIKMVKEAGTSKAPIQKLADNIAGVLFQL
jgi:cation transport ATPase